MNEQSMIDSLASVTIQLDQRRAKSDGTYPVKLCVYHKPSGRAKYYRTKFSFSPSEFESIWKTQKPRSIYKSTIEDLNSLIKKAERDLGSLDYFNFDTYEAKLFRKANDGSNVFWHYKERINHFRALERLSTADDYHYSQKSFQKFMAHLKERNLEALHFEKVNVSWLMHYEKFMLDSGKSKNTISMYVRTLRTVFIRAIHAGDIDKALHPFGKGKYEIKCSKKVKKALSIDELKILFNAEPKSPEQHRAKDFWFFSYFSNGMNIKDILYLRYGQIGRESFSFERIKTKNTDSEPEQIEVFLNEFTKMVIAEYGTKPSGNAKQLVFSFIDENQSATRQHVKTKAFTRFINQHIKKLAVENGLTQEISTYFARHSFATGLIRDGKSMAFVQEALGHASSKTTQNYMAGFLSDEKKGAAESIYHNLIS